MSTAHRERSPGLRRDFVEAAAAHRYVVDVGAWNEIDQRDEAVRRDDRQMSDGIERDTTPIRPTDIAGKNHRRHERRRRENPRRPRAGELLAAPSAARVSCAEDVGEVELFRTEWTRQRGKWLRGPRLLAGNVAARYGALFDWEERLPGFAIENEDVTHLRRLRERGNVAPAAVHGEEQRLRRHIVVPQIVVHHLKMPNHRSRRCAQRDDRVREQVLAEPFTA